MENEKMEKITLADDAVLRLIPRYAKYKAESEQLLNALKNECRNRLDKIGAMEGDDKEAAIIELKKRYIDNTETLERTGKGIAQLLSYLSPSDAEKSLSDNTVFSICSLLYNRGVF